MVARGLSQTLPRRDLKRARARERASAMKWQPHAGHPLGKKNSPPRSRPGAGTRRAIPVFFVQAAAVTQRGRNQRESLSIAGRPGAGTGRAIPSVLVQAAAVPQQGQNQRESPSTERAPFLPSPPLAGGLVASRRGVSRRRHVRLGERAAKRKVKSHRAPVRVIRFSGRR